MQLNKATLTRRLILSIPYLLIALLSTKLGWTAFSNPRIFAKYGRQRGWERVASGNETATTGSDLPDGFRELTEEETQQMEFPF